MSNQHDANRTAHQKSAPCRLLAALYLQNTDLSSDPSQAGSCTALPRPGGLHSVAVSGSGQLLSWGANQNGLLGLGAAAEQNVPTPTPIPGVFGAHVSASLGTVD